jgi:polysaccharide pyruvyl transferase WcaK-like protein
LPATSKYDSQSRAGLTSKTIHEINQYGHGVIVGGGNLYENGELDLNIEALRRLEPPMMLFSLSRGRIYNQRDILVDRTDVMPDAMIKALNQKAAYSLARDEATFTYLQSLELDNVLLGGCPTVYLDRIEKRLPDVSQADRHCTLISVRHPVLMNISLQRQMRVQNDVWEIISLLREVGHDDIRLLCHDHRDIPFAASFGSIPYVYISDPYAYLALLKNCRLNVTYRVHSALPCMAFGTPFIKLSYDERALSLMETVGFADWNIDIVNVDSVVNAVRNRLDNLDALKGARVAAAPKWDQLRDVQDLAMRQFAFDVKAYAAVSA